MVVVVHPVDHNVTRVQDEKVVDIPDIPDIARNVGAMGLTDGMLAEEGVDMFISMVRPLGYLIA